MSSEVQDRERDAQLQVLGALVDVPLADELGQRFADDGHELYIVGGTVRDTLRGPDAAGDRMDLDFATSASPEQTERVLRGWADAIWLTGARFGTVSAEKDDVLIEITTFRADSYTAGSRHPEVVYGTSIQEDLARRDFTVNAIAVAVPSRTVVDPFGGWEDLRDGVLRTPIEPEQSFGDDPLRMFRLARFTATLGLRPAPEALAAATAMAEQITTISAERIQAELDKLVCGEHVGAGMNLLVESGLADHVLPEIPALRMQRDPAHHHKDVYGHTIAVVNACPADDTTLRLAALLHDIGKPATREFLPRGLVSFHHHDVVGARMARKRLKALKYPKQVISDVSDLVRLHLRFHGYADGEWTDSAVRRYVNDAGSTEQLRRLNLLTRADVTTHDQRKKRRFARAMDDMEERIARLAEQEQIDKVRPALDGHQIMAFLGTGGGPLVGRAWAHLKDRALELGPVDADKGFELLEEWALAEGVEITGERVEAKKPRPTRSEG